MCRLPCSTARTRRIWQEHPVWQAVLDVITGRFVPEGLLPIQIPVDMKTVETQKEDVAFDMECYEDSEGNRCDFGFGMNFEGVIMDERARRYRKNKE